MKTRTPSPGTSGDISTEALRGYAKAWVLDGHYRQLSERTLDSRRDACDRLLWYLQERKRETCGPDDIRGFLTYATEAQPEGRWGNPREKRASRPGTALTYFSRFRSFFRWLVEQGFEDVNPMERLKAPLARPDQIQPFTEEQVKLLLLGAKRSKYYLRDTTVILFLLDTGVRSSELCDLKMRDLDIVGMKAMVLGKGNKRRAVYIGGTTAKALRKYLKTQVRTPDSPVFMTAMKRAFDTNSLGGLVRRLGESMGIDTVRCSPHTLRHTAAVMFLRAGGHVFALKEMLGHTTLTMTMKYVAMAQADVQAQHYQYSPVERLKGNR